MIKFKKLRALGVLACMLSGAVYSVPSMAAGASNGLPPLSVAAKTSPQVNVNTATADELAAVISGVGLQKAKAIVEFRKLNGEFLQLEELSQVKGIGAATLEKNKAMIRFK